MGWNQGTMGITKFANQNGVNVDVIKNYGQINSNPGTPSSPTG